MAVNLEFENKLWKMADKLRGNIQPSDYKSVILGLIFLKHISDSFEEKYHELIAEGEGFEEDRDAYLEDNIFFVPPSARWDYIKKSVKQSTIGQIIDDAVIAIERENKNLKGVLPKNYVDIKGFCKSATIEEVRSHEYILTPGRYVGIEEVEDDTEPFDEKMTRLTAELAEMFTQSHALEEEIKKRLGAIGYEF